MKTFIFSQDCSFIPQLIQEIPNFKAWVNGFSNDGLDILVGHADMHLFRFFVDEFGWLSMQYKLFLTDYLWSPIDSPTIRLWKVDVTGCLKLPMGIPNLVPFDLI
jgi:hypothetical protein